jgi:nitrite reductase/ring-hydroxylating ferredoxin subunit
MNAARILATPPGLELCRLADISSDGSRNFVLQMRGGHFHGFVIRRDGVVHGYVDRCPHAGVPLARTLDEYLRPDRSLIACSWHGALFTIEDGICLGGPCVGQKLIKWPVVVEDGWIKTGCVPAQPGSGQE